MADIEQLKRFADTLPGIRHDVKWRSVDVYSIHLTKMVCIFYDTDKMACKVDDDLFITLSQLPGCRPESHLARAKWVEFGPECPLPQAELEKLLSRSWQLVKDKLPKAVQALYTMPKHDLE
uniref:MmcQ/YjbR family DNA-binding protein n=1 Tax=Thaumasiovibrio occultus TaxID=1891184 RepID=UPI000B363094|nr:MmcQ/YjbR family DNA-binding protein [Thaumasiovibrio occultus]